ncbi:MAG TPA: glycoside hydrolase family 15 protein [Mucilaginibacter sp.]|nr:glycoside hydrolase family 15 protein [Mucilaginibacter sp.]
MKKANHSRPDKQQKDQLYPAIEDHGVIGDLNTIALVDINGTIDFMCFPDFDSPSVFASLLDREKGGMFCISPASGNYKTKQLYLPETNVLLTRFLSDDGIGEITDFMPVQELDHGNELIRRVTTVKGSLTYQLRCAPRFNYGRSGHSIHKKNGQEIIFSCPDINLDMRLIGSTTITINDADAVASFTLSAGESADFILLHTDKHAPATDKINEWANNNLSNNINYWRNWIDQSPCQGRWRGAVMRSALVLKLLTSNKHGSLVAAPTFSLPEEIGGDRNWDYRFTWIRDASFSVYSLLILGYTKEAGNFIKWMEHKCFDVKQKTNLQIMYRLNGDEEIDESELKTFEGYRQSAPVRIGNAACQQLQLDIYGELMDAVYLYDKEGEPISYALWENLASQMDWLADNWKKKDDGIWEVRGGQKHFIYSRLMCWVAFDRAIKIAENHSYPFDTDWKMQRNAIFTSIHQDFWNEELQAFVQYSGAKVVDAATLMMPLVGFIAATDPHWLSTMRLIEERLADGFLVYRYRKDNGVDGLKGQEGTFSMCTFWLIECLSMAGQLEKARLYFEKMLGYANHLGLFAEQLAFSGEQLGNFPQAFTHLGLISAAINLDRRLDAPKKTKSD